MEEKLDAVLKLLDTMKQEHADRQRSPRRKLEQLEQEEAALGQVEATQQVVKRLKEDRTLVFKKKGNERQFLFNDNVKDQIDMADKQLELVESPNKAQREALQKAKAPCFHAPCHHVSSVEK